MHVVDIVVVLAEAPTDNNRGLRVPSLLQCTPMFCFMQGCNSSRRLSRIEESQGK